MKQTMTKRESMRPVFILVTTLLAAHCCHADLITADPSLPPTNAVYQTAQEVHVQYSGPGLVIVLKRIEN